MLPDLLTKLLVLVLLLVSVPMHEFAHCWITYRLGDDTPRAHGRLTLNPLAHLDLLGTAMMAITVFSGFGIGWGKPSPMNPHNFRHPARDRMISAAAGPICNILMMLGWGALGTLMLTLLGPAMPPLLSMLCTLGVIVNCGLAVFNLLPIYPLDGHHILSYFIPPLRPIIDNPIWQIVFLALVLIPPLWQHVLLPIIMPMFRGLLTVQSLATGWGASF